MSRSSTKAEYHTFAYACADSIWIQRLLRELRFPFHLPVFFYYDNLSTTYMAVNPFCHARTKHIVLDYTLFESALPLTVIAFSFYLSLINLLMSSQRVYPRISYVSCPTNLSHHPSQVCEEVLIRFPKVQHLTTYP